MKNVVATGAMLALIAGSASAGTIVTLGQGWEAEIFEPVPGTVSLFVDPSPAGTLVIQKFAQFIQNDPFTGAPSAVLIQFRQISSDANTATRIVINDELITNSTGQTCTSFQMGLLDHGNAVWNQALSAGFSIAPEFTTKTYSPDSQTVTFAGGSLASGQSWAPGLVNGGMVIDINLGDSDPMVFTLKELPGIPAPGTALVGMIAVLSAGRRRR